MTIFGFREFLSETQTHRVFVRIMNTACTVNSIGTYIVDTFQDFLIAVHMKPRMDILEISISSLNHVNVRPTKTPKLADKKCAQFY